MRNTGAADLTGLSIAVGGESADDYLVNGGGLPGTLAPGEAGSFDLVFVPASRGDRAATLSIASDDADKTRSPFPRPR